MLFNDRLMFSKVLKLLVLNTHQELKQEHEACAKAMAPRKEKIIYTLYIDPPLCICVWPDGDADIQIRGGFAIVMNKDTNNECKEMLQHTSILVF